MSDKCEPEPTSFLRLRPRPDISKYAECAECKKRRVAVANLIRNSAPREEINLKRSEMQHVEEMMAGREVIAELETDASRSKKLAFICDDKLGSHWQFLPMPTNKRDSKKSASRWTYWQRLQGNTYEGIGNFLSGVPPMLHTGGSFGCSAFCVLLMYRLIQQFKLDARVERIIRQTDEGSDNVTWITHAVHYVLVREGAFNQIDW
eukprot:6014815-Pleurochrysis_carterae.AAC.1